jgi:hypothetical protein
MEERDGLDHHPEDFLSSSEPRPRPSRLTRRGFLVAGLGGGVLALLVLSRLRPRFLGGDPPYADPSTAREPLIAFMGALFGRDLTAEDHTDLSARLALFSTDATLGRDCVVFADHLQALARAENAHDFVSCDPAARQRIVERVMAVDPHSLSARLLAHVSAHMRDLSRMRWSTIPSLAWIYRHSAPAWRARGYSRWPGVPGDWRETLVPGPPYP